MLTWPHYRLLPPPFANFLDGRLGDSRSACTTLLLAAPAHIPLPTDTRMTPNIRRHWRLRHGPPYLYTSSPCTACYIQPLRVATSATPSLFGQNSLPHNAKRATKSSNDRACMVRGTVLSRLPFFGTTSARLVPAAFLYALPHFSALPHFRAAYLSAARAHHHPHDAAGRGGALTLSLFQFSTPVLRLCCLHAFSSPHSSHSSPWSRICQLDVVALRLRPGTGCGGTGLPFVRASPH